MARPVTKGSLEWVGDLEAPKPTDHWRTRVRIGKSRRWIRLPKSITRADEDKARVKALHYAQLASAGKLEKTPKTAKKVPRGEVLSDWAVRWFESRQERGRLGGRADRSKFTTWVLARLGETPVEKITREDIEAWVEWIDTQVQKQALAWKTAQNAWGLLSRAMTDASAGKVKSLRCRRDNPCDGVAPPERGVAKAKPYLYPSELLALLDCTRVPRPVRRAYAVTVYLYPRAGEVEALHWEDVDLEHGVVHLHRAKDPDTREIREVKGKAARRFEIEPELLPLLRAMRAERPHDELVFDPWPLMKYRAGELRKALVAAGVDRTELYSSSRTRKHLTFHDLRATGTTWAAIRGDEPLKIMHRAGHKDLATTMGYVREAENVRRSFGDVFPPLPKCLLGAPHSSPNSSLRLSLRERSDQEALGNTGESLVRGEGFEPSRTSSPMRLSPETKGFASGGVGSGRDAEGPSRPPGTNPGTNARETLRLAARAAIDDGDLELAEGMLELLLSRKRNKVVQLVPAVPRKKTSGG